MDQPRTDGESRRRRRTFALAAAAGLLVLAAALAISRIASGRGALEVERGTLLIDTVRRGEFVHSVRGSGTLVPREIRWVVAQAAGRVERVLVRPGAEVASETVIVELANPELETQVDEARLALTQGDAQLAAQRLALRSEVLDQKSRVAEARAQHESTRLQAEAELEASRSAAVSRLQAQRTQLLAEQQRVRLEVETERLANLERSTLAQLRAEEAKVAQLRAIAQRQRALFDSLMVRAGLAGVLQALPAEVGQQIASGAPIARVARPDELVAELRVPELDARDLRAGLTANVDMRSAEVRGTVRRVDPGVVNGTVRVEVGFEGALPAGTRPDLTVDGTIEIARVPDALFVVRPVATQPDARTTVFRLAPSGHRARRTAVEFGKASAREIIVRTGLAPGDRVIVSDTSRWTARDALDVD